MEEAFKDVNVRDYVLTVVETEIYTEATVSRNAVTPRTTRSGCPRKRDSVQGLGAAHVGNRPRMASLASIWSY